MTIEEAAQTLVDYVGSISVDEAGGLLESPEGAESIESILKVEKLVKEKKAQISAVLAERALAFDPTFTAIQAGNVRVTYQNTGSLYEVEDMGLVPEELKKPVIDTEKLNAWIKENPESLPMGIKEAERGKAIVLRLMKGVHEQV